MEEIQEVNSADQIDQLEDLRFKMKSGNFNLSSTKVGKFWETKCLGCEKKFRREKRSINMGMRLGELGSKRSGNMGLLGEYISRKFRMGSLIEGRF